jgi:hypothetical protein
MPPTSACHGKLVSREEIKRLNQFFAGLAIVQAHRFFDGKRLVGLAVPVGVFGETERVCGRADGRQHVASVIERSEQRLAESLTHLFQRVDRTANADLSA